MGRGARFGGPNTHVDLYDIPKYVDSAVAEAAPFFTEHLAAADQQA